MNAARRRLLAAEARLCAAERELAASVAPWRARCAEHAPALLAGGGVLAGCLAAFVPLAQWRRIARVAMRIAMRAAAASR